MRIRKRLFVTVAVFIIVAAAGFAEAGIYLVNPYAGAFYFIAADSEELPEEQARASLLFNKAIEHADQIRVCPPESAVALENHENGRIIYGMFKNDRNIYFLDPYTAGRKVSSARESRTAVSLREAYSIANMTFRRSQTLLSIIPEMAVDNSYKEWREESNKYTAVRRKRPEVFQRETRFGADRLTIDRALFWGAGGTRPNSIRYRYTGKDVYIYIESGSRFDERLSIFLYPFPGGKEKSSGAIEIPFRSRLGIVVWWSGNEADPEPVGEFVQNGYQSEIRIDIDLLPKDLVRRMRYLEVSSVVYDTGVYEEFPLASLPLSGRR